jgi:mycofactocin precursor peptide peptidase
VLAWYARWPGDAHAGRSETSLALALDPTRVHLHLAAAGNTAPLADLLPRMRAGGVAAVSPNGVLGDPSGASCAEGSALLDTLAADLIGEVTAWLDGRT